MDPESTGAPTGEPGQSLPPAGYPALPPPPVPYGQQPPTPAMGGGRRRGGYVALAVAGWLVLAAGTAGAVVAVGGSGPTHTTALGPGPSSSAAPSGKASATPTATPSPAPTTQAPAPSPTSTVKGSVSGNSHSGDLRFFLLPVPDGAQVFGDVNGNSESLGDIAKSMNNPSTSRRILNDFGCKGGAYRSYRTNDGAWTVNVQLIQFDGTTHASDWVSGLSFAHGNTFDIAGVSQAKGQSIDPSSSNGNQGVVIGISHDGDVEYEIDISGPGTPSRALLTQLMQRQEQRLSNGS
ncbi:hypothetical protein ABIA32_000215 [Streptacidiphilus sp. MAP12-20]|uniref:hypothetical protein n=1 Tax=Streptacidiphilus sp. MAP12-20 TaxID=3156299 RepID=UPI00351221A4